MANALDVHGVSHRFGARQVLDDVWLSVPQGAITALLGPNGAGKTTLFNLVTRLYTARAGRIAICGGDLASAPGPSLARLGVVFQSRALDPSLSVMQNLRYAAGLHGMTRAEATARAVALLTRLGLDGLQDRQVARLSGGQAQRTEIARAMMHAPRLLLCDEATAGLDIESRRLLLAEVRRLAREDGVGVLWATHLVDEIDPQDDLVVLCAGKVIAEGRAVEIAGDDGLEATYLRLTRRPAAA